MTCGEREKTRARCLATGECVQVHKYCNSYFILFSHVNTCSLCKVRMII